MVGGSDQRVVLAVGASTGLGLTLFGLHPTGQSVVDAGLLVLAGAAAAWAAASAPWWAIGALAGVAAALARPVWPLVIGLVVFALSLASAAARLRHLAAWAAIAGGSILILAASRELGGFGANTAVGVTLVASVAVLGIWHKSARERRLAVVVLVGATGTAAIAVVGFTASALAARPDLERGNTAARQGLAELRAGQFGQAEESFQRATSSFERADRDLGAPWAQPARLVPIVSQHRTAGATLASAAARATGTIARQLELIDFDALRVVDSRVDVDAVRGLDEPMRELQAALDLLDEAVRDSASPWLIAPIRRELDELEVEIARQAELGDRAQAALKLAPDLLGASGERVYLLMFTTPAEARGRVGLMGNFAELTVDNGMITLTAFGGHDELSARAASRRLTNAPRDWLARYGSFGYTTGPGATIATRMAWADVTLSPHFPSTAQVVAELYPKSGGRQVEGVVSVDVFAVERLVGLIGPVEIEEVGRPLTGDNTAQFLLLDQYQIADRTQRRDLLDLVARELIERLLADAPDPLELGRALAPMVRQDRVLAWSPDADEQGLFSAIGMGGEMLPDLRGGDGYGVTVANAANNKIDSFLEREVTLTRRTTTDGAVDVLTVTLRNDAPTEGFPPYVIDNTLGLPIGTTRIYVTVSTTATALEATIDGERAAVQPGTEAGFNTYSAFMTIEAGQSSTIELHLAPSAPDRPAVFDEQPLVRPAVWSMQPAERS